MQLQVDSEQLHNTGSSFKSITQEVKTTVGNLNSAANSASSGWSGSSAGAFQDLWRRLHNSLDMLTQAMDEIAGNLHTAGTSYSTTETNLAKSAQNSK